MWTPFRFVNPLHRHRIESICSQSVNRLSGKRYELPGTDKFRRMSNLRSRDAELAQVGQWLLPCDGSGELAVFKSICNPELAETPGG